MPPIQISLACEVVAVVPVLGLLFWLVLALVAVLSTALDVRIPLYSETMRLAESEAARLKVTVESALLMFRAYQISTVTPLVFVFWIARVHVAPVWVAEVTRLSEFPRVPMTAMRAFPLAGGL